MQECTLPVPEDEPEAEVQPLPGWRGTGVPGLEAEAIAFGGWLGVGRSREGEGGTEAWPGFLA